MQLDLFLGDWKHARALLCSSTQLYGYLWAPDVCLYYVFMGPQQSLETDHFIVLLNVTEKEMHSG